MSKILELYKAAQKSLGLDKISKEAEEKYSEVQNVIKKEWSVIITT